MSSELNDFYASLLVSTNVVTRSAGPPAQHPRPPAGGPYRAVCSPYWDGPALTVGSVLYLTMTLRPDDGVIYPSLPGPASAEGVAMLDTTPLYDIIVRFAVESAEHQDQVGLMLARQLPTYDLPEGEPEMRMRVWVRDDPSSPSGVALSKMIWVEEPGATPAQLAALKAILS